MLDEFKMMWDLRYRFPLHYIVFKQVSSHTSRKRPTSSSTSSPALASSPTPVGVNKKRFWPTVQAIKERYYLKYRGGAGSSADYEE